GGFQRAIAAADDQHVLTGELLWIVQAVIDFPEVLAGHTEFAKVSAATDGDDDSLGADGRLVVGKQHFQHVACSNDALTACRPGLDSARLRAKLYDQRLLHLRVKL